MMNLGKKAREVLVDEKEASKFIVGERHSDEPGDGNQQQ